ncbi:MAG: gamma-glutamyltransferase, partial [Gemmatimonadaceae bacterium]
MAPATRKRFSGRRFGLRDFIFVMRKDEIDAAGVLEIQKKYGHLKLSEVLQPAIRMAETGIPVYPALYNAITSE